MSSKVVQAVFKCPINDVLEKYKPTFSGENDYHQDNTELTYFAGIQSASE